MAKKTCSQRLRGVLFYLWLAKPAPKEDFSNYYEGVMESLIEKFKEKLPGSAMPEYEEDLYKQFYS